MAVISNIFIDAGTDFTTTVTVTDSTGSAVNLSGYSHAAQIRKSYDSSSATASFTTTTSDASAGQFTLALSNSQTAAIPHGRYVYDAVITSGSGTKTRVVEGIVTINPRVTQ
tara:strand:- start:989 stop:1324 length:336 start_codon:yes stop_codon:yes gene_type:complete